MSEIDAAELARLRDDVEICKVNVVISKTQLLSLIDALEKARGNGGVLRLRAERDSARALLREIHGWLDINTIDRARIERELTK